MRNIYFFYNFLNVKEKRKRKGGKKEARFKDSEDMRDLNKIGD